MVEIMRNEMNAE